MKEHKELENIFWKLKEMLKFRKFSSFADTRMFDFLNSALKREESELNFKIKMENKEIIIETLANHKPYTHVLPFSSLSSVNLKSTLKGL